MRRLTVTAAVAAALGAPTVASAAPCVTPGPLPAAKPPTPLRFGITGQLAGSAGAVQLPVAPEDDAKAAAALRTLKRPNRPLVLRLNRMFQSDGEAGLQRFSALADRYAAAGYEVELQVRYHPAPAENGDLDAYARYVRRAVDVFAPKPAVVALSITNEANLVASQNTSDGAFANPTGAIVRGIVAAREEADRLGRGDLRLGFTYFSRFANDERFFADIGAKATPAFQAALDYVGLQLYPGLLYPPGPVDAGQATADAANLLRTCLFPMAGIGDRTRIWVTENGYRTAGGTGEARQAADLRSTVAALHRVSGTLGVTDYRYFNLRDNNSRGTDLFDAVGLLFDDYRPKQAFATYGALEDEYGADDAPSPAPAPSCTSRRRLTLRLDRRLVRATVRAVGARKVDIRRRAGRLTATVDFTGHGAGTVRVRSTGRTRAGRTLRFTRTFRLCATRA